MQSDISRLFWEPKIPEKKKKRTYRGYRLTTDECNTLHSSEMVGHIKWLGLTKTIEEVGRIFPEVNKSTLRNILSGQSRGKVDPRQSPNFPTSQKQGAS